MVAEFSCVPDRLVVLMQEVIVYIVLGIAVVVAVFLFVRAWRKPEKCTGCEHCPLVDKCEKKNEAGK